MKRFCLAFLLMGCDDVKREILPPNLPAGVQKVAEHIPKYGIYRYQDESAICYIARAKEAVAIDCIKR